MFYIIARDKVEVDAFIDRNVIPYFDVREDAYCSDGTYDYCWLPDDPKSHNYNDDNFNEFLDKNSVFYLYVFYKDKKQLNVTLNCKNNILVNNKYYFKLEVSDFEKRIYLLIFDKTNKLIERNSYIEFETLKKRLELKLSLLALVFASKKLINNHPYFRYYKITIYKLLSFENFIDLIKKNIIIISLVGRVSRSGLEAGRQRNKNLVFQIDKNNISKLFKTIETYNNDLISNNKKLVN